MAVYANIEQLIGNTPMLDLSQLTSGPNVKLYAKLEGHNPTGSLKDRIALAMVEAAEADGRLRPGDTIVEPSSGNTGISLAMLAATRGYTLKVVMPKSVSVERRQMLLAFGAQVIDSPAEEGSNGAVVLARQLAAEHPDWVMLYQYGNDINPMTHYRTTGPEILADVPDITHFVSGLGTSGTLVGAGKFLREAKPDVQIWAVEPPAGERVQGLRSLDDGFIPPVFDDWDGRDLLNRRIIVRPADSIRCARRLLTEGGLFAGLSSGAALAGALRAAEQAAPDAPCSVVFVVADYGWKYLSTGGYTDDVDEAAAAVDEIVYF